MSIEKDLVFASKINGTYQTGLIHIDNNIPKLYCLCDEGVANEIIDLHKRNHPVDVKIPQEIDVILMEPTEKVVVKEFKPETPAKKESRVEILDRLAKKVGGKDGVETFEDFLVRYNSDAVIILVRQAMAEYSRQ